MDWIATIGESCLSSLTWLAGLTAGFGVLVCLMPCNRGMAWWRDLRGFATDLLYWFVMPLFARVARTALVAVGLSFLSGEQPTGFAVIRELPLWAQCVLVLVLQDVMLYWLHRVFHTSLAWRFHAVHHSPKVLDFLSASRFHVVNYFLYVFLADVAVLLMGFSVEALLALAPINLIYSAMVHANLNWTFGPLRFVFASPVFHRWHHTSEACDKNFAATFPLLDVVFGTFHMPPGKLPANFGNGAEDFPEDFWGQLIFPFRRDSSAPVLLAERPAAKAEHSKKIAA